MDEKEDSPIPPPPPSPRPRPLPSLDITLTHPSAFLPAQHSPLDSDATPPKRQREQARPLPPDLLSGKVAQRIAQRALTHPPSLIKLLTSHPSSLLKSPPRPKKIVIPSSPPPPDTITTTPTRPHIHVTYTQCSHSENVILPASSTTTTPIKPAASTTTPNKTKNRSTTNRQVRLLHHKCANCSRNEAKAREQVIRARYRHGIESVKYWMAGLRPHPDERGTLLHCALYEARMWNDHDLRDLRARRAREISVAWRDYERVHGPREEAEESSDEWEAGSSLENSSDGLGLLSTAFGDEPVDGVAVISDEEGEGKMVAFRDDEEDEDEGKGKGKMRKREDEDVEMTGCDDDQDRGKKERKTLSTKDKIKASRTRVMDWEIEESPAARSKREWENGGKEEYARNLDEEITKLKTKLWEKQGENERAKFKKMASSQDKTLETEKTGEDSGLLSKISDEGRSKWRKTI